jgi:soluble lytic murein transglycosylase
MSIPGSGREFQSGVGVAVGAGVGASVGVASGVGDAVALGETLLALASDPGRRIAMSEAALERAERFAWPNVAREVESVYEEALSVPQPEGRVVRLAQRTGRPDHPVWVVRRAGAAGLMAPEEGWPTPFPTPSDLLEPALVNAISRQESNFDPEAVSSANARGLMQLLPSTAQLVARRIGVRHQVGMLTTDPAHNMRLGAAYLSDLIGRFGGALPLAVAGYNAGPGRVDEWVGTYGDPRGGSIAMLDWMEQIPFAETRNYVQRVLENVAIYRARDTGSVAGLDHPMTRWLRDAA